MYPTGIKPVGYNIIKIYIGKMQIKNKRNKKVYGEIM